MSINNLITSKKALFTPRELLLFCALMSFLLGVIVATSIRFPLLMEKVSKIEDRCGKEGVYAVYANILGDVTKITCGDGTEVEIFNPPAQ
jgi:hypothetical protein